ncbi:MAG: response regulator [Coriobacteriia bacterium]|nr:response regulator [Coriobacteriia bacterium]
MERASTPLIFSVDDDEDIRDLITAILEGGAYRVASAASGSEALAQLEGLHPDLILLDAMMPDMDGYEVCDRLQARGVA